MLDLWSRELSIRFDGIDIKQESSSILLLDFSKDDGQLNYGKLSRCIQMKNALVNKSVNSLHDSDNKTITTNTTLDAKDDNV